MTLHMHNITMCVMSHNVSLQSLTLILVAKQLLKAYLQNGTVDFAHFWQADGYA